MPGRVSRVYGHSGVFWESGAEVGKIDAVLVEDPTDDGAMAYAQSLVAGLLAEAAAGNGYESPELSITLVPTAEWVYGVGEYPPHPIERLVDSDEVVSWQPVEVWAPGELD